MTGAIVLLAHAGHWIEALGFVVPAIVLPIALLYLAIQERRGVR